MQKNPTVAARIPRHLRELMIDHLDVHISEGDFIRDAIREKIERDSIQLYGSLLERKEEVGPNVRGRGRPRRLPSRIPSRGSP